MKLIPPIIFDVSLKLLIFEFEVYFEYLIIVQRMNSKKNYILHIKNSQRPTII